jgi:methyl-accepting chemotaxis protein
MEFESSATAMVGMRRYGGVLRQIEGRILRLLAQVTRMSGAAKRLNGLAEDMRILSLNAELVAGRAGQRGAGVRALTQYTRGLVRRLTEINSGTTGLNDLYAQCARSQVGLRHLHQIEMALVKLGTALQDGYGQQAGQMLDAARQSYFTEVVSNIEGMLAGVDAMTKLVRVVDDVVGQAQSIATNIATEAVGAGSHEAEFVAVSTTMNRYVEDLRRMNDQSAKALRFSARECSGLRDILSALGYQATTAAA